MKKYDLTALTVDFRVSETHIWKRYAIGLKYFPALPIKNIEMNRMVSAEFGRRKS